MGACKEKMKEIKEKAKIHAQRAKERAKASAKKFNNELKKAINTAIIAAFGFLIALAWRDLIQKGIEELVKDNALHSQLISTLIITIVSVLGILIVTRIFSEKKDVKKEIEAEQD